MQMINSIEELLKAARAATLHEHTSSNIELKSNWHREDGKKISARVNKKSDESCWLCIGIDDRGTLVGHDEQWARVTEEIISGHLNQFLDPTQACKELSCHDLNGKWIIVIEINNPGSVVYWNNKAYKSAGTTISEMMPDEIMALTVSLPGLSDFSSQNWNGEHNATLVDEFRRIIVEKRDSEIFGLSNGLSSGQILERIGIKGTTSERILFGDISFRVVYYNEKEEPIKNISIQGLFNLLTDGFINHIQKWTSDASGIVDPYPELALREALANAVAHAAYFESGGELIIELFHYKLTISNLCVHESTFFANKWFSKSHKTINRALMETLRMAGFVDELGRGKTLIFTESLKNGKQPPIVNIESGGRYSRWRLYLYGGTRNRIQLRMFSRIKEIYGDERKALIAYALVLWKNQPVADIRKYIDGESSPLFAEVLSDLSGPIFYYQKNDEIVLRRWARVLLGEGKDSKQFSDAEEEDLKEFTYNMQTKYHKGYITPKELRDLAAMGDTQSEISLSSKILKKWQKQGIVKKIRRGNYKFVPKEVTKSVRLLELVRKLTEGTD